MDKSAVKRSRGDEYYSYQNEQEQAKDAESIGSKGDFGITDDRPPEGAALVKKAENAPSGNGEGGDAQPAVPAEDQGIEALFICQPDQHADGEVDKDKSPTGPAPDGARNAGQPCADGVMLPVDEYRD